MQAVVHASYRPSRRARELPNSAAPDAREHQVRPHLETAGLQLGDKLVEQGLPYLARQTGFAVA